MEKSTIKTRNDILDSIKGILAILVVFGHAIQYGSGPDFLSNMDFFDDFLFKIIYSFHMPLFGLLSGIVYGRYLASKGIGHKIKSCFKHYLFPMMFAGVFQMFLNGITGSWKEILRSYKNIVLYQWWFLWVIIICYMIFGILDFFNINMFLKVVFILLIQIIMLIVPEYGISPHVGNLFFYFTIGYLFVSSQTGLFSCCSLVENIEKRRKLFIVGCYILTIFFWNRNIYIYTSGLNIVKDMPRQLYIDLYRWAAGLLGCIIWMHIFISLISVLPSIIKKLLSYLGKKTMLLYIVQIMVLPHMLSYWKWYCKGQYLVNLIQTIIFIFLICMIDFVICRAWNNIKIIFAKITKE